MKIFVKSACRLENLVGLQHPEAEHAERDDGADGQNTCMPEDSGSMHETKTR